MIIVESRKQIKPAKRRIRKQLREYGITLKELKGREECMVHYNTIKAAFSEDSYYWNQALIDLAEKMIDEKKQTTKSTI